MASKYEYTSVIQDLWIIRLLNYLDKFVTKHLQEIHVKPRLPQSNGLWCCGLLPTILGLYSLQYKVSLLYSTIACASIGILCYTLLFIAFLSVSPSVLKDNVTGGGIASSVVTTLLLYGLLEHELVFSVMLSITVIYSFRTLFKYLIMNCQKTFTVGEAMIVVQGTVLLITALILEVFTNFGDQTDPQMMFINSINVTISISVGMIITAMIFLKHSMNMKLLYSIISLVGTFALVILHIRIGVDCIMEIVYYIVFDMVKVQLIFLWLVLSCMSGLILYVQTQMATRATSAARKLFHISAALVFLSGIIWDVHLITLAACFGLALIILGEALRKSNIEELSQPLQSAFHAFKDEKDSGFFAMTAIYLYVGLACPLILVPKHDNYQLELLSGVLSIGVGDTAASWFGFHYGTVKWKGSQKSVVGTTMNILAQIGTVSAIESFGWLNVRHCMFRTVIAAVVSGLVEAKTDQIDNLILPLVSIVSFQATGWL